MNPSLTIEPNARTIEPVVNPTRPLYWSIRREIWENRSLYIAPLIVTAVVVFGSIFAVGSLPRKIRSMSSEGTAKQHATIVKPFTLAPAPIMLSTFVVGLFYCLDALYGERRERGILFWKSLPVSDTTTVLSKAAIPMVVMPLFAWLLSVLATAFLMTLGTLIFMANGISPGRLWSEMNFVQEPLVMIYGLAVHALWFAPVYAWLLLVSAWARRAPLVWAVFPLLGMLALERVVSGTSNVASFLGYRFIGAMGVAFKVAKSDAGIIDRLSQLTPGRFLTTPALWLGLLFAAACIAAAIRLRRNREPI